MESSRYLVTVNNDGTAARSRKVTTEIIGYMDSPIPENNPASAYKLNCGYIDRDTEYIYIFTGTDRLNVNYPTFYIGPDRKIHKSPPSEEYHTRWLTIESRDKIIDMTDLTEETFTKEQRAAINSSMSVNVPVIHDADDFLTKVVKSVIIAKGINTSRLSAEVDKKHLLNNLMQALNKQHSMSTMYFNRWVELLKFNIVIEASDTGKDRIDPLTEPIRYNLQEDKITDVDGYPLDMDYAASKMKDKLKKVSYAED